MQITRQKTQWGYIDWMEEPSIQEINNTSFSYVILNPGQRQDDHIHYAEWQFLQILSGTVRHYINGVAKDYVAGDSVFIPVGASHAQENRGDETATQLRIRFPVNFRSTSKTTANSPIGLEEADPGFMRQVFRQGIRQLSKETIGHLSMPVVVTDASHNYQYHTHLDHQCLNCRTHDCPLWSSSQPQIRQFGEKCETTVCPNGLTVLMQPVKFDDTIVGYIKGGLFIEHPSLFEGETSPLFTPGTAFHSTLVFLQDMNSYLIEYYKDRKLERELLQSKNVIRKEEQHLMAVVSAYEESRDVALNLQIRNHFLFNTLNSIAALAVEDGSFGTYTAILNLSDLFRGLLRKEGTRVPLSEELDFLKNYLDLEKLRYENKLSIDWRIGKGTTDIIVPHNILQPVVENSFVHAFSNMPGEKKISVSTVRKDNRIIIKMKDNGCGMNSETLKSVKDSMRVSHAHGLSMVTRKLSGVFGTDFSLDIDSKAGKGTTYTIILPV